MLLRMPLINDQYDAHEDIMELAGYYLRVLLDNGIYNECMDILNNILDNNLVDYNTLTTHEETLN